MKETILTCDFCGRKEDKENPSCHRILATVITFADEVYKGEICAECERAFRDVYLAKFTRERT